MNVKLGRMFFFFFLAIQCSLFFHTAIGRARGVHGERRDNVKAKALVECAVMGRRRSISSLRSNFMGGQAYLNFIRYYLLPCCRASKWWRVAVPARLWWRRSDWESSPCSGKPPWGPKWLSRGLQKEINLFAFLPSFLYCILSQLSLLWFLLFLWKYTQKPFANKNMCPSACYMSSFSSFQTQKVGPKKTARIQ